MRNIFDIFINLGMGLLTLIKFAILNAVIIFLCMACYVFYVFLSEKTKNKGLRILLFILMTAIAIFFIYLWFRLFGIYAIILPSFIAFLLLFDLFICMTDEKI